MDKHTFIGKRKVGSTDICDFTDYQGIGHDPLYKRYESVNSIVKKHIDPAYIHFLSAPDYSSEEDAVNWYIDDWNELPVRFVELESEKRDKYTQIKDRTISHYKEVLNNLSGEELQVMACVLRYIDEEFIYCCDDKVYLLAWGMTPDGKKHIPKGELVHEAPNFIKYKIEFEPGENGHFSNKYGRTISLPKDSTVSENDLPKIEPNDGFKFKGWHPNPIGLKVNSDMFFSALYEKIEKPTEIIEEPVIPPIPPIPPEPRIPPQPSKAQIRFNAGSNGILNGNPIIYKTIGSRILSSDIPGIKPNKGQVFKGWDVNPIDYIVKGNTQFNAIYEEKIPWYKKVWLWFTGIGCLKWLLWLLLALLLCVLLSWFLRGCHGCTRETNGVIDSPYIVTPAGDTIDDNGVVRPIDIDNGRLPKENTIVAPIRDENGVTAPIIRDPGVPPIVANRLFLFLENENDNIDDLAVDFKKSYPGDQYSIIGYDRDVKSLLIQIPENERDEIRRTINSRIPNHDFIVFDEEIYELNGHVSESSISNPGWHLQAINAPQGWNVTRGDPSVVVAVIDDGINASHPMFKDKIVNAYNVYTQNNQLSIGQGHGTHTAGLAVGSDKFFSQGASGVAPDCKLMPVQVIDNNMCPLSALVSGIMYALHKNADIINVSIGPSFEGLNQLPIELQNQIAETQFKNVEKLWNRVSKLAAKKNTILVFAAGNDDIISSIPPENRSNVSITVGAVDQNLYPTDFTNYGPCTDISAPGKEIYSSFPVNDFRSFDGTSMAAPLVSGTIALMKSLKKDISVEQAFNVLYNTGIDVYGNMPPMIQVDLALDAVKRGDFSEPKPRNLRPVPDRQSTIPDQEIPSSWGFQDPITVIEDNSNNTIITGGNENLPINDNNDEYESIRRLIKIYKQKIVELEGQLPENKR